MGNTQMTKKVLTRRNVAFMARCARGDSGLVRVSPWVHNLPEEKRTELAKLVLNYSDWNEKTDLTGTKSAGIVMYDGHTIIWRIKEYDPLQGAVLTLDDPPLTLGLFIMHSSEV